MSLFTKMPVRAFRPAAVRPALARSFFTREEAAEHAAKLDLSRKPIVGLSPEESRESVLHLYRKICRLMPHVLKSFELEGEDAYFRAVANIRLQFEHHRKLRDPSIITVLRHRAESEIEETLLLYKTKSHTAAMLFEEPQLSSILRANEKLLENPDAQQNGNAPSPFMQAFLSGSA